MSTKSTSKIQKYINTIGLGTIITFILSAIIFFTKLDSKIDVLKKTNEEQNSRIKQLENIKKKIDNYPDMDGIWERLNYKNKGDTAYAISNINDKLKMRIMQYHNKIFIMSTSLRFFHCGSGEYNEKLDNYELHVLRKDMENGCETFFDGSLKLTEKGRLKCIVDIDTNMDSCDLKKDFHEESEYRRIY